MLFTSMWRPDQSFCIGVNRKYLASYLDEFMWRRSMCEDRYDAAEKILEVLAQMYPPSNGTETVSEVNIDEVDELDEVSGDDAFDVSGKIYFI
jgi:hypothetical protein